MAVFTGTRKTETRWCFQWPIIIEKYDDWCWLVSFHLPMHRETFVEAQVYTQTLDLTSRIRNPCTTVGLITSAEQFKEFYGKPSATPKSIRETFDLTGTTDMRSEADHLCALLHIVASDD